MSARYLIVAVLLAACSPDVTTPPAGEILLDDIEFPYSLYDADGHHYAVLTGIDSAGTWSLHIRDALPFARIRDAGALLEIDLFANGDSVARLSVGRAPLVPRLDCFDAEAAYLKAAADLMASASLLESHWDRRRAALTARAFETTWRARETCLMPD